MALLRALSIVKSVEVTGLLFKIINLEINTIRINYVNSKIMLTIEV
jgi:hypothetical protein